MPLTQHGPMPRVDFAWPDRRLIVEVDGWQAHRTRVAFQDDRTNTNRLQLAGQHRPPLHLGRRPDPARGGRRSGPLRREPLQHPLRPELVPPVRAPADQDVVAGARVDRELALDREPLVVLPDQLVDVGERPTIAPGRAIGARTSPGRRGAPRAARCTRARACGSRGRSASIFPSRSIQRGLTPAWRYASTLRRVCRARRESGFRRRRPARGPVPGDARPRCAGPRPASCRPPLHPMLGPAMMLW